MIHSPLPWSLRYVETILGYETLRLTQVIDAAGNPIAAFADYNDAEFILSDRFEEERHQLTMHLDDVEGEMKHMQKELHENDDQLEKAEAILLLLTHKEPDFAMIATMAKEYLKSA